jgi:L-rhamnose-H+ transport protein
MGQTAYVGWAVLMASAILFSTLLGIGLGEWKGTSTRTRALLGIGLAMLILTAVISGYSGFLAKQG